MIRFVVSFLVSWTLSWLWKSWVSSSTRTPARYIILLKISARSDFLCLLRWSKLGDCVLAFILPSCLRVFSFFLLNYEMNSINFYAVGNVNNSKGVIFICKIHYVVGGILFGTPASRDVWDEEHSFWKCLVAQSSPPTRLPLPLPAPSSQHQPPAIGSFYSGLRLECIYFF